jgi:hypothetical protein
MTSRILFSCGLGLACLSISSAPALSFPSRVPAGPLASYTVLSGTLFVRVTRVEPKSNQDATPLVVRVNSVTPYALMPGQTAFLSTSMNQKFKLTVLEPNGQLLSFAPPDTSTLVALSPTRFLICVQLSSGSPYFTLIAFKPCADSAAGHSFPN